MRPKYKTQKANAPKNYQTEKATLTRRRSCLAKSNNNNTISEKK